MLTLTSDLKARLHKQAVLCGFDDMRITTPDAVPQVAQALQSFITQGYHGQMTWLAERSHWRGDPAALWPQARSVIMLAQNYAPPHNPLDDLAQRDSGNISVYARAKDYHTVVKKRLKRLARWLISQQAAEVKVFVDTAPVPEKPLAQAAGLGWQGKHTNLISRKLGNWFFLGAIFTTLELPPDTAQKDHCGGCRRCLDICPTNAFPAPYQLDARRCISYLTIEHKGEVDPKLRPLLGNRIYGCDDCLAICPWNKFAQAARDAAFHARPELEAPPLKMLVQLDDAAFRQLFAGSPIKRIGRDRFVRNVLYAIGNSQNPSYIPKIAALRQDADTAVADAAKWATARLQASSAAP